MSINFLDEKCLVITQADRFGIRDGVDSQPAYLVFDGSEKWVAIVTNPDNIQVNFHAVDDCVEMLRESGDNESRCDAILTYPENIVFVELKESQKGATTGGIRQLRSTIALFSANHDLNDFRKRRAFFANRKHPTFNYSRKEEIQRFYQEIRVRLVLHNEIQI